MEAAELALIGVGLSMDAFAVAVCKGLAMRKIDMRYAVILAVFFGGFQALMPILGWLAGIRFAKYIQAVDHWIAFGLLAFLGIRMILETIREKEEKIERLDRLPVSLQEFFLLAVATSIDALAVGITFAFLAVRILPSASLIGCITFGFSIAGVLIGNLFGIRFKKPAAIAGGVILMIIGVRILLEHLGML